MTVVNTTVFSFCFVVYVHCANPTFYRNLAILFWIRAVYANFLYILYKNAVPSFCAECQTFLTTVSALGHTFNPSYLYMEGTNGGQKK